MLKRSGVGIGYGDIAGLHGNEGFVGFEIVVAGEDASADEFFLEDGDEVEEVLGVVIADVVDFIGWDGETVGTSLFLGGVLHNADDAFYDVVDIGEVALTVAIVEDFDGFAFHQFVGEAEIGHIGAASGAIDGEEAEASGGDIIEFAIGMGHEFVALLRGSIKGDGVVYFIVGAIGHFLIAAIDATGGGIDEVLHFVVAASLEDVVEADDVALDIGIGVGDAIADTGLGGEVDDYGDLVPGEDLFYGFFVGYRGLVEGPSAMEVFYFFEAAELDVYVVIVGNAIDAYYLYVFDVVEEALY